MTRKLAAFRPQRKNANKHTQRGLTQLTRAIQSDGWIGGITVAADGETFDGSARLEVLADTMPDAEPIVVETDGTRPIVVKRTDIPNTDDPRAKRLSIGANRVAQVDLDWDAGVLEDLAGEIDLGEWWREDEMARLQGLAPEVDIDGMWQGMPEFHAEDLSAFKSIKVNFKNQRDLEKFSELVGQTITLRTRSIWYPQAERLDMTSEAYQDES